MFLYLYDNITFEMGIFLCMCYWNTFLLMYLAVIAPLKHKHKSLKVSPSKLMDSLTEIKLVFCREINNLKAPGILPCLSCFCSAVLCRAARHPLSVKTLSLPLLKEKGWTSRECRLPPTSLAQDPSINFICLLKRRNFPWRRWLSGIKG